jgi:hypothetical protein
MLGGPVGRPALQAAAWLAGLTLVFGAATVRGYSRRGRL